MVLQKLAQGILLLFIGDSNSRWVYLLLLEFSLAGKGITTTGILNWLLQRQCLDYGDHISGLFFFGGYHLSHWLCRDLLLGGDLSRWLFRRLGQSSSSIAINYSLIKNKAEGPIHILQTDPGHIHSVPAWLLAQLGGNVHFMETKTCIEFIYHLLVHARYYIKRNKIEFKNK